MKLLLCGKLRARSAQAGSRSDVAENFTDQIGSVDQSNTACVDLEHPQETQECQSWILPEHARKIVLQSGGSKMSGDYRSKLFSSYNATHVSHLDADDESKLAFFQEYTRVNYLRHLGNLDRNSAEILEIACNKGYLLAALHSLEFKKIFGVDLSPLDVEKAKQIVPSADISYADAFDYLGANVEKFDVIILKAVLEHIQKDQVISLLEGIKSSLKPTGMVIIDVPNMDWLLAQHERYMDFTHEVGFTRESLAQVMRQVFSSVHIEKGKPVMGSGLKSRLELQLRAILVRSLNLVFRLIGEGASDTWWDSRSIIGIAKND